MEARPGPRSRCFTHAWLTAFRKPCFLNKATHACAPTVSDYVAARPAETKPNIPRAPFHSSVSLTVGEITQFLTTSGYNHVWSACFLPLPICLQYWLYFSQGLSMFIAALSPFISPIFALPLCELGTEYLNRTLMKIRECLNVFLYLVVTAAIGFCYCFLWICFHRGGWISSSWWRLYQKQAVSILW